jgi:hypothetical protein
MGHSSGAGSKPPMRRHDFVDSTSTGKIGESHSGTMSKPPSGTGSSFVAGGFHDRDVPGAYVTDMRMKRPPGDHASFSPFEHEGQGHVRDPYDRTGERVSSKIMNTTIAPGADDYLESLYREREEGRRGVSAASPEPTASGMRSLLTHDDEFKAEAPTTRRGGGVTSYDASYVGRSSAEMNASRSGHPSASSYGAPSPAPARFSPMRAALSHDAMDDEHTPSASRSMRATGPSSAYDSSPMRAAMSHDRDDASGGRSGARRRGMEDSSSSSGGGYDRTAYAAEVMSSSRPWGTSSEHGREAPVSSNKFANGSNQNCGNFISERSTTRLHAPPGGHSSFSLEWK